MTDDAKAKKVDPGWNDPPTLSYSPSNPPPKSRIGNKRIAFPLSPQTSSSQPSNSKPSGAPEPKDSVLRLQDVMRNVETLLTNPDDQTREKLQVMRIMWQDNKFSSKTQGIIECMVQEMVNKNAAKANEYYLQLMMENSTLCEPWILVFRQMKDVNIIR